MRLLYGLVALAAGQLTQDVIGEGTCDDVGQNQVHDGMCECEKDCCNTPADQLVDGCPIDVVVAIDMCSCNNDTWTEMRRFTLDMVNTLSSDFGINDNDNSARLHVYQFMDYTKDVVGFDTFTKNELEKAVLGMTNAEFHGKSTDLQVAIEHAQDILEKSPRAGLPGRKAVFAFITNGYSNDHANSKELVFESAIKMDNAMDVRMVFVAREDSSMPNDRNTHTYEELTHAFDARERLQDPVAAQQIVGDVECDPAPEPSYQRECTCVCDVPMGCHGIHGPQGNDGERGGMGKTGEPGDQGDAGEPGADGPKGPPGDQGGCGMPGDAGAKGDPGADGTNGMSGQSGEEGIQGPEGEPGNAGPKGQKGEPGPDGPTGQPGVQGEPGPEGDQGDQGPEGELDEQTLKWLVNKIFIEELNALNLQTPQT